jgi:hypothetical protein
MKFDRKLTNQIVTYYEHFLLRHDWAMRGIPFGVGDWYLLVGLGPSAVEYPLQFAAIYVDEPEVGTPVYIYVEVTEDTVQKLVIGHSLNELEPELPERALEAVNAAGGKSPI